jgi:hypothetical protein
MSQEWVSTLYAIIGLLGMIAGGLERAYEKEEKQALARSLNARILGTRDSEPYIEPRPSVFKVVFNALAGC